MTQSVCLNSNIVREPNRSDEGQAKERKEENRQEHGREVYEGGGINRNGQAEHGLVILRANRKQATLNVMLTEAL